MKNKKIIGFILMICGLIGLLACAIAAGIFYLQNPDMTALRRLIEYPAPTIWAIIYYIVAQVGLHLGK